MGNLFPRREKKQQPLPASQLKGQASIRLSTTAQASRLPARWLETGYEPETPLGPITQSVMTT